MSRIDTFIDLDNQMNGDLADILNQSGIIAQVYSSRPQEDGAVGFDVEVQDPVFIRNISGFLAPLTPAINQSSEGGKVSKVRFVFSTNYQNLAIDDVLKFKKSSFRVVAVNPLTNFHEYELERLT